MVLHISQVLKERRPFWQHINFQALMFKFMLQLRVISPLLHWPDRARIGGDGDISR